MVTRRILQITAILAILLAFSGVTQAGLRDGLIVDLNLGYGLTSVSYDNQLDPGQRLSKGSIFWDLKCGYAERRWKFYFVQKMAVFDLSKMADDYKDYFHVISEQKFMSVVHIIILPFALPLIPCESGHSLLGFGATYYVEDRVPSWFFEAGIGVSFIYNPMDTYTLDERGVVTYSAGESGSGPGGYLGAGYEFDRHFQVTVNAMYGRFTAQDKYYTDAVNFVAGPKETISALTFTSSIGFSFY